MAEVVSKVPVKTEEMAPSTIPVDFTHSLHA